MSPARLSSWSYHDLSGSQSTCEVLAALDAEFDVGVCEVCLDGPQGDEQSLRDFAVGAALGREHGDPALAGGQGVAATQFVASRPRAAREQLDASGGRECRGFTPGGKVECLA